MDDDFEDHPAVLCFASVCDIPCVSRNTLYSLCRSHAIPCQRVDHQWRLRKTQILQFLNNESE